MQQHASTFAIGREHYDSALLDLDGVIADNASLHAACWKKMLDEYLQNRARVLSILPPTIGPTWMGSLVPMAFATFSGRAISALPEGSPDDLPEAGTVAGLGNRKNDLVKKIVEQVGVSGVQVGLKGNSGLVIGVARKAMPRNFGRKGAHLV
jgi:hypothetical protein